MKSHTIASAAAGDAMEPSGEPDDQSESPNPSETSLEHSQLEPATPNQAIIHPANILILAKTLHGAGGSAWMIRLMNELKRIGTFNITCCVYEVSSHFKEFFINNGFFEKGIQELNTINDIIPQAGVCFYEMKKDYNYTDEGTMEIDTIFLNVGGSLDAIIDKGFQSIVTFNIKANDFRGKIPDDKKHRIIDVTEYADDNKASEIFFIDYKENYKSNITDKDGCLTLNMDASTFRDNLAESQKVHFDLEHINDIEKSIGSSGKYYMAYNAYQRETGSNVLCEYKNDKTKVLRQFFRNLHAMLDTVLLTKISSTDNDGVYATLLINMPNYYSIIQAEKNSEKQNNNTKETEVNLADKNPEFVFTHKIDKFEYVIDTPYIYSYNGHKFRIIGYKSFKGKEFEYLLLKSEDILFCTGDMTLTEALSSGRVPLYEALPHKVTLENNLRNIFNTALGELKSKNAIPQVANYKFACMNLDMRQGASPSKGLPSIVYPWNADDNTTVYTHTLADYRLVIKRFIKKLKENSLNKKLKDRVKAAMESVPY